MGGGGEIAAIGSLPGAGSGAHWGRVVKREGEPPILESGVSFSLLFMVKVEATVGRQVGSKEQASG